VHDHQQDIRQNLEELKCTLPDVASDVSRGWEELLRPSSMQRLKNFAGVLKGALHMNPKLAQELEGDAIYADLFSLLKASEDGPYALESDAMAKYAEAYVKNIWNQLTVSETSSDVLLDNFDEKNKEYVSRTQELSKKISDKKASAERQSKEVERINVSLDYLKQLEEKVDALGRPDELVQRLKEELTSFQASHLEDKQQHNHEVALHESEKNGLLKRLSVLDDYAEKQDVLASQFSDSSMQKGKDYQEQLREQIDLLSTTLGNIADIVQKDREQQAACQSFRHRTEVAHGIVSDTKALLSERMAMHQKLSERWANGAALSEKFAAWLQKVYSAMQLKTEKTGEKLRKSLPEDGLKHQALCLALESDIARQKDELTTARGISVELGQQLEAKIRLKELSGASSDTLSELESELQEIYNAMKWQEKQLEELDSLNDSLDKVEAGYQEKVKVAGVDNDSRALVASSANQREEDTDRWVRQCFFTHSRPSLFQPDGRKNIPIRDATSALQVFDIGSETSAAPCPTESEADSQGFIHLRECGSEGGLTSARLSKHELIARGLHRLH